MEAEAIKEVMDDLFGGKVTFQAAMERLSVSEDELHKMIDVYEYTPTKEEILEANMMMLENLENIEREISISFKKSMPQNIRHTDATGTFQSSPKTVCPATDVIEAIKSKDITIATASGSHNPYDLGYFG